MKLAFTTLGCPDWDMDTIIARGAEYGFDGIDFRGYRGEMDIYKLPEFITGADECVTRIRDLGMEVPCLSSSARIFSKPEEALEEIKAYAEVCARFNTPMIRVFCGGLDGTPWPEAIRVATDTLRRSLPVLDAHNVNITVETHDDWVDSTYMKQLMEAVDSPRVGVLWDVHHPYRMAKESPATTWRNIGPWVTNTHWKDSAIDDSHDRGYRHCLMGKGDLPLKDIMTSLKEGGYKGYLTLEWEKKWHPEIEEPETAFPQYVRFMKALTG